MNKSVLFVCLGNICRSPTGEGLMRHLVQQEGLEDEVDVESAGTISYHVGESPDPRMSRAASRRGYTLRGRSRQLTVDDFDRFDLILGMDSENLADIRELESQRTQSTAGKAEVRLLSSFLPAGSPTDVPDPYYGGDRGFETVMDMIEEACPAILEHLIDRT